MEYGRWITGAVYGRCAMKAKNDAWKIAEQAAKELPPYLADGELTAERFYKAHTVELHNADDARKLLELLVDTGKLAKEERRTGRGGSHVFVYVAKG